MIKKLLILCTGAVILGGIGAILNISFLNATGNTRQINWQSPAQIKRPSAPERTAQLMQTGHFKANAPANIAAQSNQDTAQKPEATLPRVLSVYEADNQIKISLKTKDGTLLEALPGDTLPGGWSITHVKDMDRVTFSNGTRDIEVNIFAAKEGDQSSPQRAGRNRRGRNVTNRNQRRSRSRNRPRN